MSHNIAAIAQVADRIGVMYAGRLVEIGRAEDVLHGPRHPYTRSLIAAIPGLEGVMPAGLPGSPPLSGPEKAGCEFRDRCPRAEAGCAHRAYAMAQVGKDHFAACAAGGGDGT